MALVTSIVGIAFLSMDVVRKIEQQATASTDNVQWTVAQINVEYLQLLIAVEELHDGQADLQDLRRRFDVFYSRMLTMERSPIFSTLRQDATFAQSYERAWEFLERQVEVIDSDDAVLKARLPAFTEEVKALRPDASAMGLTGLRIFARKTDLTREGIARTLLQVSVLTLGLIVAMGVLAATLARMNAAIKRQARQNVAQAERIKAVFATSLEAIIVADSHGHILEFNAAAENMFGYTSQEVLGQPMGNFIVPDHLRDAHDKGMENYRTSGTQKVIGRGHIRLEARRKSGEVFPIELAISVSEEHEDTIFISYLRDLSAQVAAEEELYRARDNALAGEKAKAELLAVMSHEMRTPLNGMLGTMELLKETRLTAKQQQYHRIMESSGRLLLHHVNDVLDIVRLDSGKATVTPQNVDVASLISDIVESQMPVAKAGFNQLLAFFPEDGRTVIECDPLRLRQVLLNLVGNALKFTRNGEVRIEVERMDAAEQIEFRVLDTGIGIKEADIDRIFDDFVTLDASYSRSASGTGLGLGIVRRWVTAMGGEVGVESELGEGSLFWVRLPLQKPATRPDMPLEVEQARHAKDHTPPRKLAVLVVEDNPVNRLVVREMLELDGHTVMEANDGEEGVLMAAMRKWDVILMDVSMPRKDGVEATIAIRASKGASAEVPIVALTAHALPSETERFHAAGMQEIMTKPVSRTALRQVLRRVTNGADPGQHAAPRRRAVVAKTATVPLVDTTVLNELLETLGPKVYGKTVETFAQEVTAHLPHWRSLDSSGALAADRIEDIRREVHQIAGSAAMLGAARFRSHLVAAETACKQGRARDIGAALTRAAEIWPQTHEALAAIAEAPQAKGGE